MSPSPLAGTYPTVPESRLTQGSWIELDRTEDVQSRPVDIPGLNVDRVDIQTNTLLYENESLRERLAGQTAGLFDQPVELFFASRLSFDPNILSLPKTEEEVLNTTENQLEGLVTELLASNGVENVQLVESSVLPIDTGEDARLRIYEGELPVAQYLTPVQYSGTTIEFEPSKEAIRFRCLVAFWEHQNTTLIAGGAFPNEPEPIEFQATSQDAPAELLTQLSLQFEFTPEKSETFLRSVMAGVY